MSSDVGSAIQKFCDTVDCMPSIITYISFQSSIHYLKFIQYYPLETVITADWRIFDFDVWYVHLIFPAVFKPNLLTV